MSDSKPALDPENTLYLDLKHGRVVIELFPDGRAVACRPDQDAGAARLL